MAVNHRKNYKYLSLLFVLFFLTSYLPLQNAQAASEPEKVLPRHLFAPVPGVTIDAPATPFIGDNLSITVLFDNTSAADTGYGPYINLFLPLSGADGTSSGGPNDGISFVSATYLSYNLTTNVLNCLAGSTVTHPLTGEILTCPAQPAGLYSPFVWQLVVITLPFGSFVPDQPPLEISIDANLSNYADLNVPLPIQAQGGFMYGADPLDNPVSDPPITGGMTAQNVIPSLITIEKAYSGPEDETATGPNYPRQYTITVSIANGQTVTDLDVDDTLPDNMQFTQLISTNPAATCTSPSTSNPGGTLSCNFASVAGTATVVFEYFIPLNDVNGLPVIDPDSGDDVLSCNNASGLGDWDPLDPRDLGSTDNAAVDPPGCEHELTDKSIAIQKDARIVEGGIPEPGKHIEYTIDFQVSDFFAFQDLMVDDTISDGQHFTSSFTPTLTINGNTYTLPSAAVSSGNFSVDCNYTGAPGPECDSASGVTDGTTDIIFDVSNEIVSRGQSGKMIGGCVPVGGTGGSDPDCGNYNDGATTGQIIFRTTIQEDFTDEYPSGDPSVDQGDILVDDVLIYGNLLSVSDTTTPTGQGEADDSHSSVTIPHGEITKSIYAHNGSTSFATPLIVAPGDTVTYRIIYTLPDSDFEDLLITDYLPLPIYHSTEVTSFSNTQCGIPAAGNSCLGSSDTYHSRPSANVPVLSTNGAANSLSWTYGDYDAVNNTSSQIDLLFTVTVDNIPFADGLFLTNQAYASEGTTNGTGSTAADIIQVKISEPVVGISKGVVWTDRTDATFNPSDIGPVTFDGTSGSCSGRLGGTVNSSGLAAHPVDSNLQGVDAGDKVMMAIILENTGSHDAFDVRVKDDLPAGMTYEAGSLCVIDGTGAAFSYTDLGGGLFGSGIELDDPGPTDPPAGALDPGKQGDGTIIDTGRNIAVITYLATLDSSVEPEQTLTNTTTLFNYAGAEGGDDHTGDDKTDTAAVETNPPAIAKSLESTNQSFTSDTDVAVGEMATYTVTLTIPEGTITNAIISDTLDPGLAFVSCDSITPSSAAVSASNGFSCANAVFSNNSSGTLESGEADARVMTYDFGTITNTDTDNSSAETIILEYTAIVLNSASIQRNYVKKNNASFSYGSGNSVQTGGPNLTVLESLLNVDKIANPTSGDAGDTINYTVTIAHDSSSNTDAFEAHLRDDLSSLPVTVVGVNAPSFSGTCGTPAVTDNSAGNVVDFEITPFPLGCSATVTYSVTLNNSVSAGQVVTNQADIDWTSLPGDVTSPQTGNNNLSCERTGNTAGCGGSNNDYTANDPADVTITTAPVKSIVSTSEDSTGTQSNGERLVVGEIVRYRLQVQWPEGTSINAILRDRIRNHMQFLDQVPPVTSKLAFVCNGGTGCMNSSTLGTAPIISGNETTVDTITPAFVLPDSAVSANRNSNDNNYGSGTDVWFKLGDLVNNDNDPDQEFVIVEFNALVLNDTANQSGSGRRNDFQIYVDDVVRATSPYVIIRVAEPHLTLSKNITTPPTDAGDPIAYSLVITNDSSGNNRATAFDLVFTDTLDTNLIPGIVAVSSTQGATCVGPSGAGTTAFSTTHNVSGQLVTVTATCLDPGETITVAIDATVKNDVPAGLEIPNTGLVTYTSLPGNGSDPNPTGSTTPGGSGDGDGERNGDDGVGGTLNDYAADASAAADLAQPAIDKQAPTPDSAPIGGEVTFPILVTLPEGNTQALVVTDALPAGLGYVNHNVVTTAANSNGLLAADFNGTLPSPTVTVPPGSGGDLVLDFGDVVTNADNDASNNAFVIFVTARVLNEIGNQNGDTLPNTAHLTYDDPASGTTTVADPNAEIATVLEPELQIVKSADNTAPSYGDTINYTLDISHLTTSTVTAYDIVVTDTITSGLTYAAGSIGAPAGWNTDDSAAPTLRWTCSSPCSLGTTETAALTYSVTVNGPPAPPNPGDVLENIASMTWTSLDGGDSNERTGADGTGGLNDYFDDSTENVTLTYPDLQISKTDNQTTYTPGAPVVYTVVVRNVGNADAVNSTVSDTKPAEITSWTWACSGTSGGATGCDGYGPGALDFTDTVSLPAGAVITYTVTADTDPAAISDLVNTAVVDPPEGITDPTPDDNSSTDTDTPDIQADLMVAKDDGVDMYVPGEVITYTIVVSNAGPSNAPGSSVSDPIPPQVASWDWSCTAQNGGASGCDPYSGSGSFTDDVDLPVGGAITYQVVTTISPSATGNLTNTVTVATPSGITDPTPENNTATDVDVENAQADLSVTKDDGQVEYTPGVPLTYTITIQNNGPSDVTGVSVSDPKPAQIISWDWSCTTSGGATCTPQSGLTGDFSDMVDMPLNSIITYTVSAEIDSAATGDLVNTVTIDHPADTTPNDNTATDTDTQNSQADLSVLKDDGVDLYVPGTTVTYTITVTNAGPSDVLGALVSDDIPVQVASWDWNCTAQTGGASGCDGIVGSTGNFTDTVDLPSGSTIVYTVTANIYSSASDDLENVVTVTPPDGVTDPTPGNNTDNDIDTPDPQADLQITKDDGLDEYVPGTVITYTIVVSNTGPSDVISAVVSDPKPAQIFSWDWSCVTSGGATCTPQSGLTGDFSDTVDMPAGSVITYTVVSAISSSATGNLENIVTVTPPDGITDPTPDNNTDNDIDTQNSEADLGVTKDDGLTIISAGQTITYTVTVSNAGPSDALGAVINDPIPAGVDSWDWICASTSGGASGCDGITGSSSDFDDTVDLPAGGLIVYQVVARISDTASGDLVNTITVTAPADVTDPNPDNDSATDTDAIATTGKSLVETNQDFTVDGEVAIGEILTYEVTLTVPPGEMEGLQLVDTLDQGLAFVDCESITPSGQGLTTSIPGGFDAVCNDPANPTVETEPAGSTNPADPGRKIIFDFGTVVNADSSSAVLTVRYRVVVLNNAENLRDGTLNNQAVWTWGDSILTAQAQEVKIIEPTLTVEKSVEPKTVMPGGNVTFSIVVAHADESNSPAFDLVLEDIVPLGLQYVPGTLRYVSGQVPTELDDSAAPTLHVRWDVFANNDENSVIAFDAVVGNLPPGKKITNVATLEWTSLPGDVTDPQSPYNSTSTERFYDPGDPINNYGASSEAQLGTLMADIEKKVLPATGFTPNVVTSLPIQPLTKQYADLGDFWLEIPKLNVSIPIVGVPLTEDGWDLTWLGANAGWLEGTAYPTHEGNAALTSHVTLADGTDGPFAGLESLVWGDTIIIHSGGQRYVYEVRLMRQIWPNNLYILRHQNFPWLTLLTCKDYNEFSGSYTYRYSVGAVLIRVEDE